MMHVFCELLSIPEGKEWNSIARLEEEHLRSRRMLYCNVMCATIDPHSFKYF